MGGLFTEPAATAPTGSEIPPGWEQPIDSISSYQLEVFRCGRVSIGPYERPVTGMTEVHNKITVPPQCVEFKPDILGVYVMVALWLDDQEVADYLHRTYGMPVRVAQFDYVDDATAQQRRWSWSTGDSPASEMGMPFVADDSFESADTTRMVWHNGTAVSMWDTADVQRNENFVYLLAVYGVLREPMLHARADGEPVVGRGESSTGEKTQAIYRFRDLECKEPL